MILVNVVATRPVGDDSGLPPGLQAAAQPVFGDGSTCVTTSDASTHLRNALDDAGFAQWTIVSGPGIHPDGCVTAAFETSDRRVVLVATARPEVKAALERVREELFTRCLDGDEAMELVRSVLVGLGERNPTVRADGPVVVPISREAEVTQHVADGCFVYSGISWTEDGTPIYLVGGGQATTSESP